MPWASEVSRISKRLRGPLSWAIALLLFGVSLTFRFLLAQWLDPEKFLTFYPAIAASTLLCGWRQGVVVLVLSALSAWYWFFEPAGSFAVSKTNATAAVIGFLMVGGFLVLVIAGMIQLIERLEQANRMQQSLFRELQHRVANNLTMVVALLGNARRGLRDQAAVDTLMEAEERIAVMAQMHRRLHDATAYAKGLEPIIIDVLREAFRDLPVNIRVSVSVDVELSVDQMTAIVFLVNEAATNAAKHVFRKGNGTLFEVGLCKQPDVYAAAQ